MKTIKKLFFVNTRDQKLFESPSGSGSKTRIANFRAKVVDREEGRRYKVAKISICNQIGLFFSSCYSSCCIASNSSQGKLAKWYESGKEMLDAELDVIRILR